MPGQRAGLRGPLSGDSGLIPSKETAASDVDRGILCARAVKIVAKFQVTCVMENNGSDGQVPIPLGQRGNNRIAPVRSEQFGDRGGRLHSMIKIMKCRIACLKSRVASMEKVEGKWDQIFGRTGFCIAESFLENPVGEFLGG